MQIKIKIINSLHPPFKKAGKYGSLKGNTKGDPGDNVDPFMLKKTLGKGEFQSQNRVYLFFFF